MYVQATSRVKFSYTRQKNILLVFLVSTAHVIQRSIDVEGGYRTNAQEETEKVPPSSYCTINCTRSNFVEG